VKEAEGHKETDKRYRKQTEWDEEGERRRGRAEGHRETD
jgi:hypothetical protein